MSLPAELTFNFAFGEPLALWGLLASVVILGVTWHARRRRRRAAALLGGSPALRTGASEWRLLAVGVLLALACASAVVAAARPQWGEGDQLLEQRGIDLVIALDVSRSMLADDVLPNRAVAAERGLAEMLTHLTGNRVGLVLFAGSAFERSPLTVDLQAVTSLIRRAQAESPLVQPGTNFDAAVAAALQALDVPDPARQQAILVVSDGEEIEETLAAAIARANASGVPVFTVFAGTTTPTGLPSVQGTVDVTTGDPTTLSALARETGGVTRPVGQMAGLAVEFRRMQQTQFASDTALAPVERFAWPAGAAVILLLLAMAVGESGRSRRPQLRPRLRRGVVTAVLWGGLAIFIAGCGTVAWRHVEAGNRAYELGDYEMALAEYRRASEAAPDEVAVGYNLANALYALRRYEEAGVAAEESAVAAVELGDAEIALLTRYTLGNTAFRRTEMEAARDAYQAVLRIDPTDRDAKANLELVLAILEPPPPPPPPEDDDGEQPDDGEDGDGDDGNGNGGQQPGGQPQPGDGDGDGGAAEGTPGGAPGGGQLGEEFDPGEGASLDDIRGLLEQALGELGPEITLEDALRILTLAQRANELTPLPSRSGGEIPAR